MSVFGDFQQVWLQRFPQSDLPARWEEDVRANLAKHKQKVTTLKEELEKEEVYVEYLERLISDIEENKKAIEIQNSENEGNVLEKKDAISDNLSKRKSELIVPTAPPLESPENENAVNKCITELITENQIKPPKSESFNSEAATPTANDPSSFVTVIEVNGLKSSVVQQTSSASPTSSIKPKPPIKPRLCTSQTSHQDESPARTSSIESLRSTRSSIEQLSLHEEPFYDNVAPDDASMVTSINSSSENVFTTASTLPMPAVRHTLLQANTLEPQSPDLASNYVNIEYFLLRKTETHSSSDDEDVPELRRNVDEYNSSSSLDSSTPASKRKYSLGSNVSIDPKADEERSSMYKSILRNIIDSESNYVDWLNVLLQYMKAFRATVHSSQPVLSDAEFQTIFYKIPELHVLHSNFLENLKRHSTKWDTKIGDCFKNMALNLNLYGAFLGNYGRALDTVRKCSDANSQFAIITKEITCKQLSEQPMSLEDLLHKPVARVQKNALVLHDLLKCIPKSHQDYNSLQEALDYTQKFLDEFNIIQTKSMFPATDRAQRRLVKNSFIVEYADNNRKLRHLFLFNDVIACAKYKSSGGKTEKYTFEVKWFIPVEDIVIEEPTTNPYEVSSSNIVSLKSQASNIRDQLRQEERNAEDKKIRLGRSSEKYKKRLLELESQLVLVSPNLIFKLKHAQMQKSYIFFLSSEYERMQWSDTIRTLQTTAMPPAPTSNALDLMELQVWITACRTYLIPNMGSYLLRSGHDESLLVGDLHITIHEMQGLEYIADLYICIEVDFYGHFFCKAKTKTKINTTGTFIWNESFVIDLEGCENMRLLVYREHGSHSNFTPNSSSHSLVLGKCTQQLSRKWLGPSTIDKRVEINHCELRIGLKFIPYEGNIRGVPTGKAGALFGEKIQQVCRRQKRDIPFIVSACIREVERRGMSEVGIYRVSGSTSDLQKLKKSFESNSYEAEQLLKEVDVHSVTGILKLYLRELPEALFTDKLYPTLIEAFNDCNGNLSKRTQQLKERFAELPPPNKSTIQFILDHLIRVNEHENENKMSLHNLATVFGPTLLHPAGKGDSGKQKDALATGTADVMAQAGGISDVVGRKRVMITCLVGIMISYILWALSTNFAIFILARFLGGISKGNVSLSMAIITDVSSMKTRGVGMALIGIAFSLGFILGPVIGALFSVWAKSKTGEWYIVPALFAALLALSDLLFFTTFFKETLPPEKRAKSIWKSLENAYALINLGNLFRFSMVTDMKPSNLKQLQLLGSVYFVYLFIYSGLEFTLTFLTHHVFNYSSMEQGWMFFFIGLTMAIIQGGYVRRVPQDKIKSVAINGLWLIIPSFICVGLAKERNLLIVGLLLFAISTAMVVPCMMTMASQYGSEHQKGTVMGIFRSLGALARALGPIVASIAFWGIGSSTTYLIGSVGLLWPVLQLKNHS
ncbi:EG:23E12.2 [Trypoxylus dichotomus]